MVSECVYWVEIVSEETYVYRHDMILTYKLVLAYENTSILFRNLFSPRINFDKILEARAITFVTGQLHY